VATSTVNRRAAGDDDLRGARELDLWRLPLGDVGARAWVSHDTGRDQHREHRPQQPRAPGRGVAVDAEAFEIVDRCQTHKA
jgi:hypothetical protein